MVNADTNEWRIINSRNFTPEEIAAVDNAVVIATELGNSVILFMRGGGSIIMRLMPDSSKGMGENIDLNEAKLITLEKRGEADTYRIQV